MTKTIVAVDGQRCLLHPSGTKDSHRPLPRTLEEHHIIPVPWQRFWAPPNPEEHDALLGDNELESTETANGFEPWDRRVSVICATGHANVHFWLGLFMSKYRSITALPEGPARVGEAIAQVRRELRSTPQRFDTTSTEVATAKSTMLRWLGAGGSLLAVAEKGLGNGLVDPPPPSTGYAGG